MWGERMGIDVNFNTNPNSRGVNFHGASSSSVVFVKGGYSYSNVRVGTTAEWEAQPLLIGEKNVVYIYTDHLIDEDGNPIPGYKVGDGLGYLGTAPFDDAIMMKHINNTDIHITAEEREFWNNKVSVYIDADNPERLIFTTE